MKRITALAELAGLVSVPLLAAMFLATIGAMSLILLMGVMAACVAAVFG